MRSLYTSGWTSTGRWPTEFAREMVAMPGMPKYQRITVLEGYAFGMKNIREQTSDVLRSQGYVVHCAIL